MDRDYPNTDKQRRKFKAKVITATILNEIYRSGILYTDYNGDQMMAELAKEDLVGVIEKLL